MTPLRQQMMAALQLNGKSPATVEAYVREVSLRLATSEIFFLPVLALSVIFRAKFRAAIDNAGLLDRIPSQVWQQPWVVHCQPVGDGTPRLAVSGPLCFPRGHCQQPHPQLSGRRGDLQFPG